MRRISVLSLVVCAMCATAFTPSASAGLISSCQSDATVGVGVQSGVPVLGDLVALGCWTPRGAYCASGCRATLQGNADAGVLTGRITVTGVGPAGPTSRAATCGPVVTVLAARPVLCKTTITIPPLEAVDEVRCTLEGVAAVRTLLYCTLETLG